MSRTLATAIWSRYEWHHRLSSPLTSNHEDSQRLGLSTDAIGEATRIHRPAKLPSQWEVSQFEIGWRPERESGDTVEHFMVDALQKDDGSVCKRQEV
jgi:hypothetical protein